MKIEASGEITLLFLVFLVLKLTHFIDWSWWWVTAPLWIPIAIIIVISLIIILGGLFLTMLD